MPPRIEDLPREAIEPYQPFECIQEIEIDWMGAPLLLKPVAILDDVHALHPDQFEQIFTALARREIKFGRWLMMRLDALSPARKSVGSGKSVSGRVNSGGSRMIETKKQQRTN